MANITPDEFITTLFPPDLLLPDERVCIAHPAQFVRDGVRVDYYRQFNYHPGCMAAPDSYYFCVSTVQRQRRRQIRKRLDDVRTAFVLVVDDVGTKSAWPDVEGSYVLETSAGNHQIGWLLEPFGVSGDRAGYYDRCLMALAAAGFNDPGFRSASRLARVPGSVHRTGFVARMAAWAPWRVWDLPDLMEALGVDVPAGPIYRRGRLPGVVTALDGVTDPLYRWLAGRGMVRGHNADFAHIECPWRAGHTGGAQGATSTGFSPRGYGRYMARGFRCLHGHCAGYGIREFEQWARARGAIIDINEAVL
jgi:hypothetical protein